MVAFQNTIRVLVAAAVWWHTVVGCCAHHAHAEPVALGSIATETPGSIATETLGGDATSGAHSLCAAASHADAGERCGDRHSPERDLEIRTEDCHHGPTGNRSECPESRCAFAALSSSGSMLLDEFSQEAVCPLETGVSATSSAHSPAAVARRGDEFPDGDSVGAPRRHLLLGILLL